MQFSYPDDSKSCQIDLKIFVIIDYSPFRPVYDCVLVRSPKLFNGEL